MKSTRLEAFSDGVLAIVITIMVLEIKVPHDASFAALAKLFPVFISYVLSFIYIGIYWNNHHHTLHAIKKGINGNIMWANMHLLFWLSLIPFATGWMGEHDFAQKPMITYGIILLMCAIAYTILLRQIVAKEGKDSEIAIAMGKDKKGKISVLLYVMGIISAFFSEWLSLGLFGLVALMWLIPDKRIENIFNERS